MTPVRTSPIGVSNVCAGMLAIEICAMIISSKSYFFLLEINGSCDPIRDDDPGFFLFFFFCF